MTLLSCAILCYMKKNMFKTNEKKQYEQFPHFAFADPPRNGKILYDTKSDQYYCHVQSKPAPNYVWLWVQEDGTKTILSSDQWVKIILNLAKYVKNKS